MYPQPSLFELPGQLPPTISQFTGRWRPLSNFYEAVVHLDGVAYPTLEHAYQAAKTLDPAARAAIAAATTPGRAKRAGRKVPVRADWDDIRLDIMETLVREKFSHPHLANFLRSTAPAPLIEGNTWGDTFWGVCNGVGENHLGHILEKVRAELLK